MQQDHEMCFKCPKFFWAWVGFKLTTPPENGWYKKVELTVILPIMEFVFLCWGWLWIQGGFGGDIHNMCDTGQLFLRGWSCLTVNTGTVCQMSCWWTKNSFHSINIWDTVTKALPSCSSYQAPSYEPNLTLLAWLLSEFAYLNMLFILEVVCTTSRINSMFK